MRAWLIADEEEKTERYKEIEAMMPFSSEDLKELFEMLKDKDGLKSSEQRKVAAIIKKTTVVEENFKPALINYLNFVETREEAEELLTKFPPTKVEDLKALAVLLTDPTKEIQRTAERIFDELPVSKASRPDLAVFHNALLEILDTDPNKIATTVATRLLAKTGPTSEVVHQLVVLMQAGNFRTRACAVEALQDISPSSEAVNLALVEALKNPVSMHAAKDLLLAFAPVTKPVQEALTKLLEGGDAGTRQVAAELLEELPADQEVLTTQIRALMAACLRPRNQ